MLTKDAIINALRTGVPPDGVEASGLGFWRDAVIQFLTFDEASGLGFWRDAVIQFLTFDEAQTVPDLLADDAKPWPDDSVRPLTEEGVLAEMREYMEFAWGKVEDHRGISAGRSVEKIGAFVALLGRFDVLREMESAGYTNYGAPKLAVACHAFNLPIPDDDGVQRMILGERCGSDYDCGCGCG